MRQRSRNALDRVGGAYLRECSRLLRSEEATDEQSFYPALNNILTEVGAVAEPKRTTIPHPAARQSDFPDNSIYEERSQVLVLPVEAKPRDFSLEALLRLPQASRYARSFGGGHVLLTNLWQFMWAELDPEGNLVERDHVDLVADRDHLLRARPPLVPGSIGRLNDMLNAACSVRSVITDASQVATLLAYHAGRMSDAVQAAGRPHDLLRPLAVSMRDGLGMHLEEEFFTPTVVQTLVYGVFAAWMEIEDPREFDYRDTVDLLRVRVVAELFHHILDPTFVRMCNLKPHIEAVARVLSWVDRDAFNKQFDHFAIEYFYEPFLAKFDPTLRDRLGVWYTPREVAVYQVERVHGHLQRELGIQAGIADQRAIILDPAVGTGTYLVAALKRIYEHHLANNEPRTIAASRTLEAAGKRVIGFEVLPAALVVAHLSIERFLRSIGAQIPEDYRIRVYLTNSLLGWGVGERGAGEGGAVPVPLPGVESELRESLRVKNEEEVLVIIGNPPYQGFSAAETQEEIRLLQDWIEPLWPEYGVRKHRLGDLYVRFWRIAVRKIAELTKKGVISFITNRKWLGGRSFPAMRSHILHNFERVIVDDLHGDVHDTTHPDDGSVFTTTVAPGIQRGVAIVTAVRTGELGRLATAERRDFRGSGEAKRQALLGLVETNDLDRGLTRVHPARENNWRLVHDTGADDPALDEYFQTVFSGVQPVRDAAVTDWDRTRLWGRITSYFDEDLSDGDLFQRYPEFAIVRKGYNAEVTRQGLLRDKQFDSSSIVPFLFKPFDCRWLYWEMAHGLLHRARRELGHYWTEEQVFIVAPQTPRRPGAARPTATHAVPGFHSVDPDARGLPRIAPQQRPEAEDQRGLRFGRGAGAEWTTNIEPSWVAAALRRGFTAGEAEAGDAIFYALLAVMHAPTWLVTIGTDNDDFPGVPVPGEPSVLERARDLGVRLLSLLDCSVSVEGVTVGTIAPNLAEIAIPDGSQSRSLTAGTTLHGGRYAIKGGGTIFWDDSSGWRNVPQEVWNYSIGGFQVLPKWLGYRHSRSGNNLTDGDLETVTHICRRIAALLALDLELNAIYQAALANPLTTEAELMT